MLDALLITQLLLTGFMTGLIWFVQVVHYPLFIRVGREAFLAYESDHVKRTTRVVAPVMLSEAAIAAVLLFVAPAGLLLALAWIGLALLALVWLSTAGLQVPCHRMLSRAFDPAAAARLCDTNWIRTFGWTARLVLAAAMLIASLQHRATAVPTP